MESWAAAPKGTGGELFLRNRGNLCLCLCICASVCLKCLKPGLRGFKSGLRGLRLGLRSLKPGLKSLKPSLRGLKASLVSLITGLGASNLATVERSLWTVASVQSFLGSSQAYITLGFVFEDFMLGQTSGISRQALGPLIRTMWPVARPVGPLKRLW